MLELLGGKSVINGATSSSLLLPKTMSTKYLNEKVFFLLLKVVKIWLRTVLEIGRLHDCIV